MTNFYRLVILHGYTFAIYDSGLGLGLVETPDLPFIITKPWRA